MKLYSYFRSSATFRVRIALNLKGVPYEVVPLHLLKGGGEQFSEAYIQTNPASLIPALEDDGQVLTQSLAIIEYLDERYPEAPLLPADPASRAYVRAIALAIACDIHPLNNLRVLRYLVRDLKLPDEKKDAWVRHWIELGLGQVERLVASSGHSGRYAVRRPGDDRRSGDRAADLQRQALRLRPGQGSHLECDHRSLHASGCVRPRPAVGSAGRRIVKPRRSTADENAARGRAVGAGRPA